MSNYAVLLAGLVLILGVAIIVVVTVDIRRTRAFRVEFGRAVPVRRVRVTYISNDQRMVISEAHIETLRAVNQLSGNGDRMFVIGNLRDLDSFDAIILDAACVLRVELIR